MLNHVLVSTIDKFTDEIDYGISLSYRKTTEGIRLNTTLFVRDSQKRKAIELQFLESSDENMQCLYWITADSNKSTSKPSHLFDSFCFSENSFAAADTAMLYFDVENPIKIYHYLFNLLSLY